ncbi:hypothetical protein LZ31DRAFT_300129 [Colletotrichum somersetense]|nr:hypothetical protein LZ31DRAFT_300129 [Colletotrichum somersetense]
MRIRPTGSRASETPYQGGQRRVTQRAGAIAHVPRGRKLQKQHPPTSLQPCPQDPSEMVNNTEHIAGRRFPESIERPSFPTRTTPFPLSHPTGCQGTNIGRRYLPATASGPQVHALFRAVGCRRLLQAFAERNDWLRFCAFSLVAQGGEGRGKKPCAWSARMIFPTANPDTPCGLLSEQKRKPDALHE